VSGVSQVRATKLKAEGSKRSEGVSYLDQTGCFLAGGGARMKDHENEDYIHEFPYLIKLSAFGCQPLR
jgi:hypothetical protein